jgi:hypothetical protein
MNSELQQYDVVALLEDVPAEKLVRGHVGTIVEIYAPDAFEVEFSDHRTGITYAMCVLRASQLLTLHYEPVESA